jgi:iron complex outermembrane receptor protein
MTMPRVRDQKVNLKIPFRSARNPARFRVTFAIAILRPISIFCLAAWFLVLFLVLPVYGQKSPTDLSQYTIEDLMRTEVATVYSASKFQQKVTDAPASVTIVTADEIRKYGYRTLAEVLRSVPGLFVDYDRNYSYVGLRGFSRPGDYSSGMLLLIDGHRTNDNIYDSPNFGTEFMLDVDLIKRVEVIRGAASVLYGSNAFFGVINVITKRGRDVRGAEISLDSGSLGTYRARASYGLDALEGPEVLLSGTIYDSHGNQKLFFPEFDSPATHRGIAVDADRDKFYNFFGSLEFRAFSLRAASDWREKGIPTASFDSVFNDSRSQTTDWSSYVDLKYQRTLGSGWQVSGHLAYDRAGYDGIYVKDYTEAGTLPFTLNIDHTRGNWWTVGLDASRQFRKKHRISLGTETRINVRQNQNNNDLFPSASYFNLRQSSTVPAIYAQDEYSITRNLILSGGVRYDHYALFGGSTNPRFAVIYNPSKNTSIKIIYGQAFRAPSPYELFLAANANLKPETLKAPELDLNHSFSQHVSLCAAAFYNRIDSLIIQHLDADGNSSFTNQGSVRTAGIGVTLAGRWPSGWEGRLAYTIQDSRNANPSDPVNNYPKHLPKFNLIAPVYRKKLFLALEARYLSDRQTVLGGRVGGYFVSNATVSAANLARGLIVSLSAYNLFNRFYQDPGSAGLIENGITQDGRTLRLKITYRLTSTR